MSINNIKEILKNQNINELKLTSKDHYLAEITKINAEIKSIPIFIKDINGHINIIPSFSKNTEINEGDILVYLGKKI